MHIENSKDFLCVSAVKSIYCESLNPCSRKSMTDLTPLMKQYREIKNRHLDAILLFRMGDFYEMFDQDAVTASKVLEITLTARNKSKGIETPLCGFPYHAAE